ncbi:deoxycytidylate deaminase [Aplysia californica]|uniref:dCMP deaminase n=1 Tax=Aplysia californica TaxID=6500 RepID=A0ABM0JZ74_APLCA|nr:deoxycytidylate deaminase [Aplysia californica]
MPSPKEEYSNGLSSNSNGMKSTKRTNYLEWQEYFMSIAFLSAQRSKDPRTQVGACIVNKDNKIVGIGYNGMPMGCPDDMMPWNRAENDSKEKWLQSKSPYVCHAELNAVLNKNLADVIGCSIYVALFPCNMCAQIIIQSGIREVVYYSDKYHNKPEFVASRFLMDTAGVKYRQFRPRQKKIIIDFELIETTVSEIPTMPVVNNFSNADTLIEEMAIRQRISESNVQDKANNNNSFTEKEAALRSRPELHSQQDTEHLAQHHSSGELLPQSSPRVRVMHGDTQSQSERLSEGVRSRGSGAEFDYAFTSLLFLLFLSLYTWFMSR